MGSSSLVDFLAEKFYSYSSIMRGDSFQQYGTSFLMSYSNSHSIQQYDPLRVLSELRENGILDLEVTNSSYRNVLLNQALGILCSNQSLRFFNGLEKPEYSFSHSKNAHFSPHLLNLINALNSYNYKNAFLNKSLVPCNTILCGHKNSSFIESPAMKQDTKMDLNVKKTANSPISELISDTSLNSVFCGHKHNLFSQSPEIKQTSKPETRSKNIYNSPISELKMSVNISHLPSKKQSDATDEQYNLPTTVKLNLKLANRKTKQMNKRSKNRRRRQKKFQQSDVSKSTVLSDEDDGSISSRVCFVAESPDFGCTVSFKHTGKVPKCITSFVVPVESDSDDDSEWESYDETDHCNGSNLTSDSEIDFIVSSSSSSSVKSKSSESRCSESPDYKIKVTSSVSFVVPVGDSSDDDSDWDSCDTSEFAGTSDFEFTGLFFTNLFPSQKVSSDTDCHAAVTSEDETDECKQLRKILLQVNRNWNESTKGDDVKVKSASKVTFAPDEDLIEVFPVEIYERKGEWEMYATERLRFRRKISELEKVLSPCLNPEHRSKVFKKLIESEL